MKRKIVICDVCKKDITYDDEKYKFKRYESTYVNYDTAERLKWDKLDMCKDCWRKFIDFINISRTKENDFTQMFTCADYIPTLPIPTETRLGSKYE